MEQMLQSAGALLIQALPTFFVVILLHWYLKTTLFKPLEKVLAERHAETKGAREKAAAALQNAELKVAEYDAKLRDARGQIYAEQEAWRKTLVEDQTKAVAMAREENIAIIAGAKAKLAVEIDGARAKLNQEAEGLADRIAAKILAGTNN